jgi:hypothetical protein
MTTTTADFIIDFLANLQGMDRLRTSIEDERAAVIDLSTTAIIEAHPEWTSGEFLLYERANGTKWLVRTIKIVPQLIMRHVSALNISQGNSAKDQYRLIVQHFHRETGIGL